MQVTERRAGNLAGYMYSIQAGSRGMNDSYDHPSHTIPQAFLQSGPVGRSPIDGLIDSRQPSQDAS